MMNVQKRLYRSRDDRMIAGICGGLGDYLNVDPTIVRLVTVVFGLMLGLPILAYLIGWIVIPTEY
ncbi:PspC domain-containing protein [Gemmatimonas aurantiaca]|nr:PspC domain-containing protein [Gemmatimonas aurantiaca]